MPTSPGTQSPRGVLAVLCVAQFVLILDVAVVNVALVPLAGDLGVAADGLQVVASAYAACFGGALLLGGRLADSGRRRTTFLVGLVLFAVASLVCGGAGTVAVLVAGRAAQGLGAALASPAALSLLTTTFAGAARDRALGTWAAVAAAGGAAGLLAGGILTDLAGWRSVFLVNPPIIAAVVLVGRRLLPADRPVSAGARIPVGPGFAAACAVVLLVGALGVLEADGPPGVAAAALAGAVVAAAAFALLDRRAAQPLLPPDLLRSRSVLAANGVTALMSAVVLGVNFFLAVHLQGRLGLGPVATGLAFLPITAVSAASATAAARLVARRGPRALLVAGMVAMTAGCGLLATLPADGGYLTAVLPGMVLVAAGMGPGFAVGAIAATSGVVQTEQGAAAALLSSSTQVGAAVGVALLGVLAAAASDPAAGTRTAFLAMAVAAAVAAACALALPARVAAHPPLAPTHDAVRRPGCP